MNFAAVFPGQGSQSLGMMNDLAASHPTVVDTFKEASEILSKDLWEVVTNGPEELLSQTETTQPLMLTAGVATWRLWLAHGGPMPPKYSYRHQKIICEGFNGHYFMLFEIPSSDIPVLFLF